MIRHIVFDKDFVMPSSNKQTYRRILWLKCSGALRCIKNNPGYYEKLKLVEQSYPNGSFNQIELDLPRTYTNLSPGTEEMKNKIAPLRNVLASYVKRNTRIGYLQGMNFLVARLLEIMNEEEAFWMLCQLSESLLPMDYYSNLLGVLIDLKVFHVLLQRKRPKLLKHMEECDPPFTVNLLAFQWFLTIFIHHANLPLETELTIWDMFFIWGDSIIFSVAITLTILMQRDILRAERFDQIYMVCNSFGKNIDRKTFLSHYVGNFKTEEIEKLRAQFRAEEVENIQASDAAPSFM